MNEFSRQRKNDLQATIQVSSLLRRIQTALDENLSESYTLRISVAKEPKWEKSKNGDEVLVRWLCWSINKGEIEVVPPEFEVVGKDVTSQTLKKELPRIFNNIKIIVDNDIEV